MNIETELLRISALALEDEPTCVARLLAATAPIAGYHGAARARAAQLIAAQRSAGHGNMIEAFLHDYGLSTEEGIAMLCLAEALLRIPDAATADALIEDTFRTGDWKAHLGKSESTLVNASTWALMLTGSVVKLGQEKDSLASWFGGLMKRSGEPVIRQVLKQAMKVIGGQFVMGETIGEAMQEARAQEKKGYTLSYDILGEGARTDAQAIAYTEAYLKGIREVASRGGTLYENAGISIKLSALHPRYQWLQWARVQRELLPRLKAILQVAKACNVAVSLDAEEANRLDMQLLIYRALLNDSDFAGFDGIGFVLQAYQKRAFHIVPLLAAMAREAGKKIPVRLVKGAYWDSEIKFAQMRGLAGYPVFTRKEHTDLSYLACAQELLTHSDVIYPQFATHNATTAATIMELARTKNIANTAMEFQRLHGMGESLHDQLVGAGADAYRCRIYAPVGAHKDLLAYLIRRMLENGANTSFVHLLMDNTRSIETLTESPLTLARASGGTPNPATPLPRALYGAARENSAGFELGYRAHYETMQQELTRAATTLVNTPADIPLHEIPARIAQAEQAWPTWDALGFNARATILRTAAERMEASPYTWLALLQQEGKKTIDDAIAEWREAIDFMRYYAAEAERIGAPQTLAGPTGESNVLSLHGRGVWVCISPWNFPLAIFIGQVAAALVTGNGVLAKPAEQTPTIAAQAVALLHEAGVPDSVLQLFCGQGETVGAALVAQPSIAGVCFTGSTLVAKHIQRALASKDGPIVPLIAETGGQNVMIVDSSALLESAVDDMLLSAFGSAGQRCSACRIVAVQEEIAPALRALLCGAMDMLQLGAPHIFTTDIPPVIDADAQKNLLAYIEATKRTARWWHAAPAPAQALPCMVAPHVFGIDSIAHLRDEQFGPVLHFITFKDSARDTLLKEIAGLGYGLTFGLHTRVKSRMDSWLNAAHIGNRYVNRSMIGAVVGVQPFGGEGLSGTGPKAGGPHYLPRFCAERTTTINTAAIGGNLELLS